MENKNQKGEQGRKRKRKMSKKKKAKRRRQWKFKVLEVQRITSKLQSSSLQLIIYFQSWNSDSHRYKFMQHVDVLNSQKPSGYEQCAPWQYIPILWVGITFPTDFQSRTWCLETDVAWCCWWCTRYTTDLFSSMWTETISQHFSLLVPIDGSTS